LTELFEKLKGGRFWDTVYIRLVIQQVVWFGVHIHVYC